MPIDFRAWARVYAFFRRWREHGRVKEFHDRLRGRVRIAEGRRAEPTAGIIDAQSVKAAASVPSASCGYDGGKKINGSKRHVIVDSLDLLLMLWVTPADGTDRGAARSMLPQLAARARTHAQPAGHGASAGRPSPGQGRARPRAAGYRGRPRRRMSPAARRAAGRIAELAWRACLPALARSDPPRARTDAKR
ncbi:transposase [Streptomyces sp. NBC_00842]|uniref:transposase n=1 Tax=unclassified Streptomyces TaxID=2593676 RepID=UPI00386EC247